jgi:hypothetical protein
MIKMFINFSYQMEKGAEIWFINKEKMVRSVGHLARQLAVSIPWESHKIS